jgi:hypothetical protein
MELRAGGCRVRSRTSVTEDTLLIVREADLSAQLTGVKEMARRLSDIDDRLHARVAGHLNELVEGCETALKDVENSVGDPAAWQKLRAAQNKVGLFSRETLAFTEGALLRRSGVDGGFCALADKLLDHFNHVERKLNWRGFTILAETAFFGEIGEVIRLRFPEISIWHLPVAAHEFGHYANPTIRVEVRDGSFTGSEYPIGEFLRGKWNKINQKPWFHAHEFMADIFAVYTLGAAYAYCVLFLRPDPGTVRAATTTHPSWNERYHVILETLGRIVQHGGVTPQVARDVERRWESTLSASAGSSKPDVQELRKLVDFFYPLLDVNLRGVRYATFGRAQQLVSALRSGDQLPGATIPDILNAAWLARFYDLNDGRETARIGRNATKGCEAA